MSPATEPAALFAAHYVDLTSPDAEAAVVQRLRDPGLVTFDGLTRRDDVLAFASRIMVMTPHRDSDPDGLTTIRDTPRRHLAGFAGLGREELLPELPRVFRTGNSAVIYAAACISSSSSMTSCGVL